jgi:archaellum component FlaG (FlaF/FlaG flagellin family)
VVGALLLILILLLVYAFLIRDDTTTTASVSSASSSSSATATTTKALETSQIETTTSKPPGGDEGTEGDFTFSVKDTDRGQTITSVITDSLQVTANGEYFVVYLDMKNNGTAPAIFVGNLQQLNADGTAYSPDDTASSYLGGGAVSINPGDSVEVPVAFDVPVGTEPTTIMVHAVPGGTGVELPL